MKKENELYISWGIEDIDFKDNLVAKIDIPFIGRIGLHVNKKLNNTFTVYMYNHNNYYDTFWKYEKSHFTDIKVAKLYITQVFNKRLIKFKEIINNLEVK